jgi:23S rRNA (uracil1939-C5)-methyltransferase
MGPQRLVGRVEDRLRELPEPDLIYTNPPRTGMDARVTEGIANSGARRIAYVSCDPATLARDLARLATTHRVTGVMAFDQFPQTAHVECVATLEHR